MRIAVHTLGTRGDVQPYVALAKGLRGAGYSVVLATAGRFEGFVREHGIEFVALPDDLLDLMDTPAGRAAVSGRRAIGPTLRLLSEVRPRMRRFLDAQWGAAEGADAIVFHPKAIGGAHIAERLRIPAFLALPLPALTPTRAFPSPMLPFADLGPLNATSHRIFLRSANAVFRGPINRWREEILGLPPSARDDRVGGVPVPRLYAYSPAVVPRPADWDEHQHVTGSWFLDDAGGWEPSEDLRRFIACGSPPVYVGFGSIPSEKPDRATELVHRALRLAGARGVLASGWGGLGRGDGGADAFVLDAAPHDRLFPLMSAVVHHGGAGTTAAGLRASRPTVVCPRFGDQPFWGRRVVALGAGPAPIPARQMSVERLARAIDMAVNSGEMGRRASRLGTVIRGEGGVSAAVGVLSQYLRKPVR